MRISWTILKVLLVFHILLSSIQFASVGLVELFRALRYALFPGIYLLSCMYLFASLGLVVLFIQCLKYDWQKPIRSKDDWLTIQSNILIRNFSWLAKIVAINLCLFSSIVIFSMAVIAPRTVNSCFECTAYMFDLVGDFQAAERSFKIGRCAEDSSFLAESSHLRQEFYGVKPDDYRFEEIILKEYGIQSPQNIYRLTALSQFYESGNDKAKALHYMETALNVSEQMNDKREAIYPMYCVAWLQLSMNEKEKCIDTLIELKNRMLTDRNLRCIPISWLASLAKDTGNEALIKNFDDLSKDYKVAQKLRKTDTALRHSPWIILSASYLIFAFVQICLLFPIKRMLLRRLSARWRKAIKSGDKETISINLLRLIELELSKKNYQAADHYSQRLLKLAEESA